MPNPQNLVKFGICPRCSRTGLDEDGNKLTGYELKEYRGQWLCQLCIIELNDSEHDKLSNQLYDEGQRFRDSLGIKYEVT